MKAYPLIIYPSDDGINHIDFPGLGADRMKGGVADSFDMTHDGVCLWAVTGVDLAGALPDGDGYARLGMTDAAITAISDESRLVESRDISPATLSCTIPAWLLAEAQRRGINCSVVLQQALLQLLDSDDDK